MTRPSCHLYQLSPVERLWNELRALGVPVDNESVTLNVDDLAKADKMSYEGTTSQVQLLETLGQSGFRLPDSHILDVGAGFGGPARFLAKKGGCRVTAFEFLSDISNAGAYLTQRCGPPISDLVTHVPADIHTLSDENVYDASHAVLSLLHVPNLPNALARIHTALKPGGVLFIEDFHVIGELGEEEKTHLQSRVGTSEQLMSREEWLAVLENECGFIDVSFEDVTESWAQFCQQRYQSYQSSLDSKIRVHGEERAKMILEFFETMSLMFSKCVREKSGLGGVRLLARKRQSP